MARPKRGEILSLTIDDLAFGGEGVGRADGYVVFVPRALPGDRLQVRLVQVRSRFGRGVIEAILEPSPQRVDAPCPYFGRCGGCRLQHVAYPAQLGFKTKQVADALERLGGLRDVPLRPIIGADEIFGYRNRMEFTVARAHRSAGSGPGGSEPPRSEPPRSEPPRSEPPRSEPPRSEPPRSEPPRSEMVVGLHETERYDSVL